MSSEPEGWEFSDLPDIDPLGTFEEEVAHADAGYSYRPGHIVCRNDAAVAAVTRLAEDRGGTPSFDPVGQDVVVVDATLDPPSDVPALRSRGLPVEPNYVVFGHGGYSSGGGCNSGCGGGCARGCGGSWGNPVYANPVYANPVYANPVYANPVYANPVYANPVYANPVLLSPVYPSPTCANPVYANVYKKTGQRSNSARPAAKAAPQLPVLPDPTGFVFIIDSGIAPAADLPPLLDGVPTLFDPPLPHSLDPAHPGYLYPANGHGTFVAGVLQELAPSRDPVPFKGITSMGHGLMTRIVRFLKWLLNVRVRGELVLNEFTVLNMSFGGYADPHMGLLHDAIREVHHRGAAIIASAGNDAVCRPMFPAAFPEVVAVGALSPTGPAPFSNFGDWVDASAPGTDLVSAFYRAYNGQMPALPQPGDGDPDEFKQWARWSGTSFAAPIVTAAILRYMALTGAPAHDAVEEVVNGPGLFRVPGYGTIVNLTPTFPG